MVVVRRHIVKDAEASKRYIAYALDCATLMGEQKPGWDGKYSGVFDLRGKARGVSGVDTCAGVLGVACLALGLQVDLGRCGVLASRNNRVLPPRPFTGLKAANCDLATLRNVFDLLQNHYPERWGGG